jgi:tetratricopeptide (TPR) repeat protein
MGDRLAQKLLLIGWGAADWQLINPLLDAGKLPTLDALIDHGAMGPLGGVPPLDSAALWTTIVTGKPAQEHGVLTTVEAEPVTGLLRPVGSAQRRVKAIWNILGEAGLRTHVVNWAATHPAERVNGIVVSDAFARLRGARDEAWPLEPGTVTPAALEATLADLRLHPGDLTAPHLLPFVPRAAEVDQRHDQRLAFIAEQVAHSTSVHAVATWILASKPWDFLAVRFDALHAITRAFVPYRLPAAESLSERDVALYQDVIPTFYGYLDLLLRRLLALAGPDTTVVIVSEHGVRSRALTRPDGAGILGHLESWRRPLGVLAIAGPGMRADELVYGATALDVVPTILTLFGLPVGADMKGRPLYALFDRELTVERRPSWDDAGPDRDASPAPAESREIDDALAALEAQGYAETPGRVARETTRLVEDYRTYNLARALLGAGRASEAADLLEKLLQDRPGTREVALFLALCRHRLGQLDACRRLVRDVLESEVEGPLTHLLDASIALRDHRRDDALRHLAQAEQHILTAPELHCQRGSIYLGLEQFADAERAYLDALALDPDYAHAHLGLALTDLRAGRPEQATDRALECLGREFWNAEAHHVLGECLARLGRAREAVHAFELCLQIQPGCSSAHRWLAAIFAQAFRDEDRAVEHRARADVLDAATRAGAAA